jgi:nitroreductase
MKNILESIRKRRSIRTYDTRQVESGKLKELKEYLADSAKGPFGNTVRLQIVEAAENENFQLKDYVSYGNVKGASLFLAGAVKKGERAFEDFGYCMEKGILAATSLGLGTVWLGGSLNRSRFAQEMNAAEDELVPAITPLGHASEHRSVKDRLVRAVSGGNNRKDFGSLFFEGSFASPLDRQACGGYAEVLEAVRLAPSASNKQPWRLLKEAGKSVYHFYMDEDKAYNSALKDIKIQNLDMGIALCHFELAARELGLEGSWQIEKPALDAGSLLYLVTWKG